MKKETRTQGTYLPAMPCTALDTVIAPAAAAIGSFAFSGCTALTSVTLGATPPTLGAYIFDGITAAQGERGKRHTGSFFNAAALHVQQNGFARYAQYPPNFPRG